MTRWFAPFAAILFASSALAQEATIDIPPKPEPAAPAPKPGPARTRAARSAAPKKAAPAKKAPARTFVEEADDASAAGGTASEAPAKQKKPGATAAPAKTPRRRTTLPPPTLSDHASRDGFGILQVAAPDAGQFIADWRIGGASKLLSTRTVADKPLFVFIVFHGCKPDAEGKCDIAADFAIHRPDGSVDDDHKGMAIWHRAAPDDAVKPVLGDGALGFGTDSEGPFGDYTITATVTDRVAGITLTTEQVLTVAAADGPPAPSVESPQP